MAGLNFKYGLYSNLFNTDGSNKIALQEGTVYVTTDERAMFVDLKNTEGSLERIRIEGTVQYYDSVESFTSTTNPPYSQDTLYFFRKIGTNDSNSVNALMAYNGESWVQVNVTLEAFNALSESVNGLGTGITNLSTRLDALLKTVDGEEEGRIVDIEGDVAGLIERLNDLYVAGEGSNPATGRVATLETDMAAAEGRLDAIDGEIAGLKTRVSDTESGLSTLSGTVGGHETRLTTAEGEIDTLQSEMSTAKTDIQELEAKDIVLNTAIEKNKTDIAGLTTTTQEQGAAITTINTDITNLKTADTTINGRIDGVAEIANANKSYIENHKTDVQNLQNTVNGHTETLSGYGTRIGNAESAIQELNGTVGGHTTQIGGLDTRIGNAENRLTALDGETGKIEAIEGEIEGIKQVNTNQGTTIGEHTAELNDIKTNVIPNLAKAKDLSDLDTELTGLIEKNAEDIGKNAEDISKNTQDIAGIKELLGDDSTSGTTLAGRVGVLEGKVEEIGGSIIAIGEKDAEQDGLIQDNTDAINTEKGRVDTLKGRVDTIDSDLNTASTGLKARVSTIEEDLNNATTGLKKQVTDIAASLNNYATITYVDDEIEELDTKLTGTINSHINAANAMTFKGVLASTTDLPTSDVHIGDTYVMSGTGSYGGSDTTVEYSAGDFFIASGTETNGVITGTIDWQHVKSGYDAAFNPTMSTVVNDNSATVVMKSFSGEPLGAVTVSGGGNVKLTSSGEAANKTISISLEWGTF